MNELLQKQLPETHACFSALQADISSYRIFLAELQNPFNFRDTMFVWNSYSPRLDKTLTIMKQSSCGDRGVASNGLLP